jgi:hypothetical protein
MASGLWLSTEQVGAWSGLLFTAYGRALLVKLAVVAVALGLGFVNAFAPREKFLAGELFAGAIVLLIAALVTNLPPASTQLTDYALTRVELTQGTIQVRVRDSHGVAVTGAQVTLTFQPLTQGLVSELALNEVGEGVYAGAGVNLTHEGAWQVLVGVNERDYENFSLIVAPDASVRSTPSTTDWRLQVVTWLNNYALSFGAVGLLTLAGVWSGLAWRTLPRSQLTLVIYLVPGLLLAGALWLWFRF